MADLGIAICTFSLWVMSRTDLQPCSAKASLMSGDMAKCDRKTLRDSCQPPST